MAAVTPVRPAPPVTPAAAAAAAADTPPGKLLMSWPSDGDS